MSRKQERRIDALRWWHRLREWEIRVQSLRITHVQRQTPLRNLTKTLLKALTKGTMVAEVPRLPQTESPLLKYKPREADKPTPKQEKRYKRRMKCEHDLKRFKQDEMEKKWGSITVECRKCGLRGWIDTATKRLNYWDHWLYE